MISFLALLLTLALWYVLFKYRVHFHFSFDISRSRTRAGLSPHRRRGEPDGAARGRDIATVPAKTRATGGADATESAPSSQETTPIQDLRSALVGLEVKPGRAQLIASQVFKENPSASFDDML